MISIYRRAILTAVLLIVPASAWSQAAKPASAKGIWEPVSYTEDIELTDVAFVTPDVGWVSGDKGTILHTKDGGKTWEAQLGGESTKNKMGRCFEVLSGLSISFEGEFVGQAHRPNSSGNISW